MQNPYSPPDAIISPLDGTAEVTLARWYHWALLILCIFFFVLVGILDVSGGAAIGSRFYAIDDIFVRAVGVGFIVAAIGLSFRKPWAFDFSIFLLAASALEIFVTSDSGGLLFWFNVFACCPIAGFMALVMWLRGVITKSSWVGRHRLRG